MLPHCPRTWRSRVATLRRTSSASTSSAVPSATARARRANSAAFSTSASASSGSVSRLSSSNFAACARSSTGSFRSSRMCSSARANETRLPRCSESPSNRIWPGARLPIPDEIAWQDVATLQPILRDQAGYHMNPERANRVLLRSEVALVRRDVADPAVTMLAVVPGDKPLAATRAARRLGRHEPFIGPPRPRDGVAVSSRRER